MTKPAPAAPRFGHTLPVVARPDPVAWDQVLRNVGYPADVLVIDFETFFCPTYSMGGTGDGLSTIEYIQDARFEILGCAFLGIHNHPYFATGLDNVANALKIYQIKFGSNLERLTIVMQNANFDATILSRKFGIHPPFLIDTLCLARHWNSRQKHGLAVLAPQFGLPAKGETEDFSGISLRRRWVKQKGKQILAGHTAKRGPKPPIQMPVATLKQLTDLALYATNDVKLEGELFKILLPKLSNPAIELRLQHHTLELMTQPELRLDFGLGESIKAALNKEIDEAVAAAGTDRESISGNITYDRLLNDAIRAAGENPQKFYKPMKRGYKLADAKSDPEREQLLNHADTGIRNLAQARAKIKSAPLHISRIERIMAMAKADGGKFPVPIRYHGAHTGRWSGAEKVNVQNLPKEGILADIKKMLIAPPGKTLAIVDAAQIEARVTAWLAGQTDLCDAFRTGDDIYSSFAARFFGVKVRKPKKTDIPAVATLMGKRRQFGKIAILGLGYGMGAAKFADFAGADQASALAVVKLYRETYPAIPRLWYDIEKAFIYTAKYRRSVALSRNLVFHSTPDCDVLMQLPNGREVKYTQVKIVRDGRGDKAEVWNELEHKHEHLWGGTLVENAVQAISRDILAEAMLRLEDLGKHTVLSCHDELVLCVPEDQGDETLKLAIDEMSRTPSWGDGMGLAAEGKVSPVYSK